MHSTELLGQVLINGLTGQVVFGTKRRVSHFPILIGYPRPFLTLPARAKYTCNFENCRESGQYSVVWAFRERFASRDA